MIKNFRSSQTKTVFDVIPNAKALSVSPSQKWIDLGTQLFLRQAIDNEDKRAPFEEHVLKIFHQKRHKCIETIQEGNWNLFMTHFMFTDLLGRLLCGNLTKMFGVYTKAEQPVEEVKKFIGAETLLLIVLDHGMKPIGKGIYGEHSDFAFYSTNVSSFNTELKGLTDIF